MHKRNLTVAEQVVFDKWLRDKGSITGRQKYEVAIKAAALEALDAVTAEELAYWNARAVQTVAPAAAASALADHVGSGVVVGAVPARILASLQT